MFTWPEKPFVVEEKENKHPGKLVLELFEPGTTSVFLFLRFPLINETANSIKYRAMIMCFSSRGKQLGRTNSHTCTQITAISRRLKKKGMYDVKLHFQ